jgi:type IV secretory pathway VirB10-like protein
MRVLAGFAIALITAWGSIGVSAQNLGDVARESRNTPRPRAKRIITNDDIPSAPSVDTTRSTAKPNETKAEASPTDSPKSDAAKTEPAKPADKAAAPSAEERLRQQLEMNDKLARQQEKVSLLERELKVSQREHDQLTLTHNNDVNARTNGQAQWEASEKQFTQDMADKQQALATERDKLQDMLEEARRAAMNPPN